MLNLLIHLINLFKNNAYQFKDLKDFKNLIVICMTLTKRTQGRWFSPGTPASDMT